MCKEDWSIRLGQQGVAWGEEAWNTFKGGGRENREVETKIFKRAASYIKRQEVGTSKRGLEPH